MGTSLASGGEGVPERDGYVVMLGNSMQGCGIDFQVLSRAVGRPVESRVSGGVMSAHKFAMLWHEVNAERKPAMAIIVFRRDNITDPTRRVTEKYGEKLRQLLTDAELIEIVERVAYPAEPDAPRPKQFGALASRSFLPEMIRAAKGAGVRLVLVRCKSSSYAEQLDADTAEMKAYTADLTRYLQERGVHFLDYVHEPGIDVACYANGDHLNEEGKRVWTGLMSEDLAALLSGQQAPRERTKVKRAHGRETP